MNDTQQKQSAGVIARVLVACKVPATWAKVIAGAVIGAVAAYMALTQSSCASSGQTNTGLDAVSIQGGQYSVSRDGRTLSWDDSTKTLCWGQTAPAVTVPPVVQRVK